MAGRRRPAGEAVGALGADGEALAGAEVAAGDSAEVRRAPEAEALDALAVAEAEPGMDASDAA
jgi:hypothetical protein